MTRLLTFDMGRLFRYEKGTAQGCSWNNPSFSLIITVWKKILAGFTASFLVIRNATVVNLSNNLAVSNVRIVFAFKRRFCRRCKINKKHRFDIVDFIYTLQDICCVLFLRVGLDITSWQPLPARRGGEGGGLLVNTKNRDDRRTGSWWGWEKFGECETKDSCRVGVIKAVLLPSKANLNPEAYSMSFRGIF